LRSSKFLKPLVIVEVAESVDDGLSAIERKVVEHCGMSRLFFIVLELKGLELVVPDHVLRQRFVVDDSGECGV